MVRLTRRPQKKSKKSQKQTLSLKERLAKKRKAREDRKKLIRLTVTCLVIGLGIGLPLVFTVSTKLGLSVALLIPSLVVSYFYPRKALWFFLIYMPFSGTVTYTIGGGNALFQLSKDVFYIPALLALIQECRRQRKPIIVSKELLLTLSILFIICLTVLFLVNGVQEAFLPYCDNLSEYEQLLRAPDGTLLINPETGIVYKTPCKEGSPFLQGILGLKVLMGYVPLIFCGYYLIEDKKQLIFLGRVLLVLAIVCCSLGLIQYLMLTSGYCAGTRGAAGGNLFRASLEARCFVGGSLLYSPSQGQIRLPGTFVSPWHWAWFLIANSFITYTVAFSDTSFLWRTGGLVGLALVFINAVISGQRIALALVPFAVFVLLILTGQIANLKRFIPAAIILSLILAVVITANPEIVQERVDSFVQRWNTAPPHLFIQKQFQFAIDAQQGILGKGLGKATNSARSFGSTVLIETFHPKILFEIGYIGLFAFMVFVTNLAFTTFKSYRLVKIPSIRSFGSSFWVFILIITYFPYWYPLDTDPVSVYYWLFAGVLLKLPEIDKEERKKLRLEEGEDLLGKTNPRKSRKRVRRRF
ncbi:MAG: hormogonium polysaccharide biosynthesis protein HpsL [Xenococcaceae cyanobacterium]